MGAAHTPYHDSTLAIQCQQMYQHIATISHCMRIVSGLFSGYSVYLGRSVRLRAGQDIRHRGRRLGVRLLRCVGWVCHAPPHWFPDWNCAFREGGGIGGCLRDRKCFAGSELNALLLRFYIPSGPEWGQWRMAAEI